MYLMNLQPFATRDYLATLCLFLADCMHRDSRPERQLPVCKGAVQL